MTTTYETDPNTQTIAAAWASSPLGQPDREVGYGFATADPTEPDAPTEIAAAARPVETTFPAKRAILAAAAASGVIGVAAIGVMLFDFSNAPQPANVAPGSSHQNAVVISSSPAPAPKQVVVPQQKTAPNVVVPAPKPAPGTSAVATPPVAVPPAAPEVGPTVVIDIPDFPTLAPPKPEAPQDPAPEPPQPVPPVQDELDFTLPDPPQPDPPKVPDFDLIAPVGP